MSAVMTYVQALALEQTFGGTYVGDRLDFHEVTAFGDPGKTYWLNCPRCAYCGSWNPDVQCVRCGALAEGVTYPAWTAR
jgi:hypothetical protein